MPLFSTLGDTRAPPCSCSNIKGIIQHIDDFIQTAPSTDARDYSLHTEKTDEKIEETCMYAMRDAIQWWANWHGSLEDHHWKHMYIAFSTIPDDVMIPPHHLIDGSFQILGCSFLDVLAGLRSEGVHPDDVVFMEKCIIRQYVLQYLEKASGELRKRLLSNTTLMTRIRVMTANTHGAGVALLAARKTKSFGVADTAVEMAAICDALSMDMGKEMLGVLQGEATETTAGDRKQLGCEMRWLYVRCLESLDSHSTGHLLRRFATSGIHFVPLMDRYRERLEHNRFPLNAPLRRRIDAYSKT